MTSSSELGWLWDLGQEDLLDLLATLPEPNKTQITQQLERIDPEVLAAQRAQLQNPASAEIEPLTPLGDRLVSITDEDRACGWDALRAGKAGCLIVAGGQGSRLRFDGPKGTFPVTRFRKKSLFRLFAEKTVAASQKAGTNLHLAVMTSPLNHQATIQHFREGHYFGLDPDQIEFFQQGTLPFLDDEGKLFLVDEENLALGPDGNGVSLRHFVKSGIYAKWRARGVEHLHFVQVDNALADPFDSGLLGVQLRQAAQVTIQAVERKDPTERVGLIGLRGGKPCVVEYTDIEDPELRYPCANISRFCFSMSFIDWLTREGFSQMPFHLAHKSAKRLGRPENKAWKFEKFIFDCLPLARRSAVVCAPREQCFAPLKNAEGPDSIATVQERLLAFDRTQFAALSGQDVSERVFELDPRFYYPTQALELAWKNRSLPDRDYIKAVGD